MRIEFSLIRIQRNDDSEHALISMLLGSEPDLASINGPIVFPVFGRGRCLLPLVDAGISPENIRDSSKFLVGGCSCTVKQLNPGFDMLVTADWSKLLKWSDDAEDSPNGARSDVTLANGGESVNEPEYVTIPSGDFAIRQRDSAGTSEVPTTSPLDQTPSSKWTITLLGVVVVTILLAVIRKSIF